MKENFEEECMRAQQRVNDGLDLKAIDPRRVQSHLLRRTQRMDNAVSAKDGVMAAIGIMEALLDEYILNSGTQGWWAMALSGKLP